MADEDSNESNQEITMEDAERVKASLRIVTNPGKSPKVECIVQVVVSIEKISEVPQMIAKTIDDIYQKCYDKGITLA